MQQSYDRTGPSAGASAKHEALTREFLTFRLGLESYGIEILKVQEIRGYEAPGLAHQVSVAAGDL